MESSSAGNSIWRTVSDGRWIERWLVFCARGTWASSELRVSICFGHQLPNGSWLAAAEQDGAEHVGRKLKPWIMRDVYESGPDFPTINSSPNWHQWVPVTGPSWSGYCCAADINKTSLLTSWHFHKYRSQSGLKGSIWIPFLFISCPGPTAFSC